MWVSCLLQLLLNWLLQVRAFAPWPGTTHTFFRTGSDDTLEAVRVNILKTEVCTSPDWPGSNQDERVAIGKNAIYVRCGDGNALSILKLQVAGRKPVDPVAFVNGLNGRTLHLHDDHFECDID